jgi:hypothetical protein
LEPWTVYLAIGAVTLFLLCALLFAVIYWRGTWQNRASRNWHSIASQVLESGVAGRGEESEPYAVYEYQAGGRTYRNDRIFLFNAPAGNPKQIAAQYPVGLPVQVYYNPNNPAEAALVRNTPSAALYLGLTMLMLFLAALMCGVYWFLSFIMAT